MSMTLYHWAPSAPSRTVYLILKTMGLEFTVEEVDKSSIDQYSPEFLAKNPQYIVPTLDDDGFILHESRAIGIYLAEKYAEIDPCGLYPKDLQDRAIVDQRLFFDATSLYPAIRNVCRSVIYRGQTEISVDLENVLNIALNDLNIFLDYDDFACGNSLTIADISLFTTVTSVKAINWNLKQFNNIEKWLRRCSYRIVGIEENKKGCEMIASVFLSKLKPITAAKEVTNQLNQTLN